MAEAILDIKHWGNNLGVRLPAAVARAAHLHADQRVRVAVEAGKSGGAKAGQLSYVLCHQPKSFGWRVRDAAPHPMKRLVDKVFADVCAVLHQIVQLA